MYVAGVIGFKDLRTFKENELEDLRYLLNQITSKYKRNISIINARLGYVIINSKVHIELQNELNNNLQRWSDIVKRLGVIPIAFGKVRIKCAKDSTYIYDYNENKIFKG